MDAEQEVHIRENRNAYRIFIRKPEGMRLFGRNRMEDDIKMHLTGIE
jgi:hypothetical protein